MVGSAENRYTWLLGVNMIFSVEGSRFSGLFHSTHINSWMWKYMSEVSFLRQEQNNEWPFNPESCWLTILRPACLQTLIWNIAVGVLYDWLIFLPGGEVILFVTSFSLYVCYDCISLYGPMNSKVCLNWKLLHFFGIQRYDNILLTSFP